MNLPTAVATHSLSAELAHRVEAFESALDAHPEADFASHLPPTDHPLFVAVLGELVRIDLEHAWTRGRAKRIPDYTSRFPAVLTNRALLAAVAFEEYRQRVRAGENPRPEEYANKFGIEITGWADLGPGSAGPFAAANEPTNQIVVPQPRDAFRTAEVPFPRPTQNRLGAAPKHNARERALADADELSDWQDSVSSLPDVGTEFVGFYLSAELGRGAFGRVYLARQGDLAGRPVALKVARGLGAESNTLAQLQHPNIVPIYSYHSAGPFQAVCMPYLGGTTLASVVQCLSQRASVPSSGKEIRSTLARGRFDSSTRGGSVGNSNIHAPSAPAPSVVAGEPVPEPAAPEVAPDGWAQLDRLPYVDAVLALGGQLADGLTHAHRRGILHRDLKPANVLLTDDGRAMLLDFNLAEDMKLRGSAERAMMGGTLPYMAPEHLEAFRTGTGTLDPRCDVYGLGVILFELLTGKHPFPRRGGHPSVMVPQMIADRAAAPSVRSLSPSVSPGAEAIVRKCLAPAPADRYQRAEDLREDVDRHLANRPLRFAPEPSARERVRKWARRHPRLSSSASVAAVAAVLFLLAGSAAVYARARTRDVEARGRLADHQTAFRDAQAFLDDRTRSSGRLDEGLDKLRAVLAGYGVSDDPSVPADWSQARAFQRLPEAERERVRGDIGETLFLMAQVALLKASVEGDGQDRDALLVRAANWNALAEGYGIDRLPRAIREQRTALAELKGDRASVERSRVEAESTPLDLPRDLYLAGTQKTRAGQHREALRHLQRATQLDPANFSAWFRRGVTHLALDQNDLAAMCFGACVSLRPGFAPAWMNRGFAFFRMRHYDSARDDYDRALKLDPKLTEAFIQRGELREATNDRAGAIEDYTRALEIGTAPVRAYFKRATAKFYTGDLDGAKADRAAGFKDAPADEMSWVARAENRWQDDPRGALADVDEALKVNPWSLVALQMKAAVLSEGLKRPADALLVLNRAVELHPDDATARAGRGVVLARTGKHDEALRDARDALRRDTRPANLYQVGCIYALTAKTHPEDAREARKLLWAGLRAGFALDVVDTDTDLNALRDDQEFKALVKDAKALHAPRPEKK